MFSLYFNLGMEHITDLNGYDHILFLMALAAVYTLKDWKKVLILVTAFTLGHSLTLALASLNMIKVAPDFIEFLIPLTILISAFIDFFQKSKVNDKKFHLYKYILAAFFGLIHGLGFSNYLRELLGSADNILQPLFAFNLGLEVGQIFIVISYLLFASILIRYAKVIKRELTLIVAGAASGISLILILERFPW